MVRHYLINIDMTFDEDNCIVMKEKYDQQNPKKSADIGSSLGMKVAIINLTGGGLSYGYINYLSEVLPRMLRHRQITQLHVFVPPGCSPYF